MLRRNLLFGAAGFAVLGLLLVSALFESAPAPSALPAQRVAIVTDAEPLPAELFAPRTGLNVASTFEAVEFWGHNKRNERLEPALDELASLMTEARDRAPAPEAELVYAAVLPDAIDLLEGLAAPDLTAPRIDSSVALAAPHASAQASIGAAPRTPAVQAIAQTFRSLVDRIEESPAATLLGFN